MRFGRLSLLSNQPAPITKEPMKKLLLSLLLTATTVMAAPTVTVVVPFPPGGFVDAFGRNIARYLSANLQQEFVVVNRSGADGRIGMDYVAQQPADGSHILIGSTGVTLFNRVLYSRLNYDYTVFDNMVPMVRTPIMFAVSTKLPVTNFAEFSKMARGNKLNCAGSSASSVFVGKYMFKQLALNDIQFVPFKGSNDMIPQLISGNIDCAFETNLVITPLAQDRKIRVLASGGQYKSSDQVLFSDIVPGLTFYNWSGVSILKNVPTAEKDRIFSALRNAARDPVYRNTMTALGLEIVENPTMGEAWLNSEYQRYETIRQQLGINRLD